MAQHRIGWLGVLLVLVPVLAHGEVLREQSQKEFAAAGLAGVRVDNGQGIVTVRRGSPGQVRLNALKIVRGSDHDEAARFAKATRVTVERQGDWLVFRVTYPQRQSIEVSFWDMVGGYEMPRTDVRLIVEVPPNLAADLKSRSGDLVTEGIDGPQSFHTISGDISVRDTRAAIRAQTTSGDFTAAGIASAVIETVSGDVEADGARGSFRVSTTSGEVRLKGAEDSVVVTSVSGDIRVPRAPRGVEARSTSGDIQVGEASGSVQLESSSGDIHVGLMTPLAKADVTTVSGDVTTRLIGDVGVRLEMRTVNGTLDLAVPLGVKNVTRRMVSGVIGDGKAPVTLRSSSGDIHLTSGEIQ